MYPEISLKQKNKEKLRQEYLYKRNILPLDEIQRKSTIIQNLATQIPGYKNANTIGIYFSKGSEVRTDLIIENALKSRKVVGLPKIRSVDVRFEGKSVDIPMHFYQVTDLPIDEQLSSGKFGVKEPSDQALKIDAEFDILFIPGIVFDRNGSRIGYGKGYYDRFLAKSHPKLVVGLGFQLQFSNLDLPCDANDKKVDMLVTEKGLLYFGR